MKKPEAETRLAGPLDVACHRFCRPSLLRSLLRQRGLQDARYSSVASSLTVRVGQAARVGSAAAEQMGPPVSSDRFNSRGEEVERLDVQDECDTCTQREFGTDGGSQAEGLARACGARQVAHRSLSRRTWRPTATSRSRRFNCTTRYRNSRQGTAFRECTVTNRLEQVVRLRPSRLASQGVVPTALPDQVSLRKRTQ